MGHVDLVHMSETQKIGDANTILKHNGTITAASDPRNNGGAAGY